MYWPHPAQCAHLYVNTEGVVTLSTLSTGQESTLHTLSKTPTNHTHILKKTHTHTHQCKRAADSTCTAAAARPLRNIYLLHSERVCTRENHHCTVHGVFFLFLECANRFHDVHLQRRKQTVQINRRAVQQFIHRSDPTV